MLYVSRVRDVCVQKQFTCSADRKKRFCTVSHFLFLPRDAIRVLTVSRCLSVARSSACLPITLAYYIEMGNDTSNFFSACYSNHSGVLAQSPLHNSRGTASARALNKRGFRKIRNIRPFPSILQRYKIGLSLLFYRRTSCRLW